MNHSVYTVVAIVQGSMHQVSLYTSSCIFARKDHWQTNKTNIELTFDLHIRTLQIGIMCTTIKLQLLRNVI